MSYQIEKLEKKQVKFTFDVEEKDWKEALTSAYNKSKNKFHVEGFRKGHVPMKVVMNMYGIEPFVDDALDIIFPKYVGEALEAEKDIKPVARPEVAITALSDTTLKFTATFQETPDVELGQYKDLEFKKVSVDETEEDKKAIEKEIDDVIAQDVEKLSTWEPIEDRAAMNGDKTVIDYSGSVDGVKFDGGTAEKQELVLGSNTFIPGFEDQVVGMKIGDTKDVKVTFPTEYHEASLAGKEAVFVVTLHEIFVKNTPAIDDEFVKDVSETADTVEDYRKEVRTHIVEEKTKNAEIELENKMVASIVESSKMEVPEVMIDDEADYMVDEFEYRLQYQGLKAEDYYKYTGSTRADLIKQYRDTAKKQVETRLVMDAIVKAENIDASDDEVETKIAETAKDMNRDVEEFKKTLQPSQISYLKNQIISDKLLAFLKDNNKFN